MASNTQFSIAVHLMIALGLKIKPEMTSAQLAVSVNASPSFIRRIMAKLSKANLVDTTTGKFGFCSLAKNPKEISLLEIYEAIGAQQTFAIHDYPVQNFCAVSCNIAKTMQKVLSKSQKAFEETLGKTTLAEVIGDIKK